MSRQAPEAIIKTAIRQYLDSAGVYWCHIQAGIGSKVGDPDLVLCVGGRFIGLEVKTPTGRLSHRQEVAGAHITSAGGLYVVVRSVEEVKKLIEQLNKV